MSAPGGGGRGGPLDHATSSGDFLLKLLQKPSSSSSATAASNSSTSNRHQQHHHHDPAVAVVGPAVPMASWQDVRPFLIPYPQSSPPQNLLPRPHSPWPHPDRFDLPGPRQPLFFPGQNPPGFLPGHDHHASPGPLRPPPMQQQQQKKNGVWDEGDLTFGSLKYEAPDLKGFASANGDHSASRAPDVPPGFGAGVGRRLPDFGRVGQMQRVELNSPSPHELSRAGRAPGGMRGKQQNRPGQIRRDSGRWADDDRERVATGRSLPLSVQLDRPGPPSGANLRSAPKADGEKLQGPSREDVGSEEGENKEGGTLSEQLMDSLVLGEESAGKKSQRQFNSSRGKDVRSNVSRGLQIPNVRMRSRRRVMECRRDIERLTPSFLSIYESLIPSEEEKVKQKQLLASLEKLVNKEWPKAQLFLYGSCANSFAFSNSDIDVCLAIDEEDASKADILLKLADILQSDNLQNVQPLTRARVPIVKLMDPVTGISCDICINNVLAVVNTKLLRDYSQIDARLHQLAFIVKHWAKSRGVNETYRGTLSSYAYVLMCIHFLQLRKPAILPCLQEMQATYVVNVDNVECAYFDKVENLRGFGSRNRESIARLLWEFFDYWAFRHDYTNDVISVRTGSLVSKREKDWTRRIGFDRHLICIEDPFEVSHDLGRVVDKYTIKILREEFERAAYVLQYDPNPNVTLFEPYVPS